jgi:hypothetical protein
MARPFTAFVGGVLAVGGASGFLGGPRIVKWLKITVFHGNSVAGKCDEDDLLPSQSPNDAEVEMDGDEE